MCPVPKKHGYGKRPVMVKGVAQSEALPPGSTGNVTRRNTSFISDGPKDDRNGWSVSSYRKVGLR